MAARPWYQIWAQLAIRSPSWWVSSCSRSTKVAAGRVAHVISTQEVLGEFLRKSVWAVAACAPMLELCRGARYFTCSLTNPYVSVACPPRSSVNTRNILKANNVRFCPTQAMLLEDFSLFTGKHTNGIDTTCFVIDIFFLPGVYLVDVSQICLSLTWFHLIYLFNYNFSLK